MIYCRTIVNFFSTLNDWKSEDKLQSFGLRNSLLHFDFTFVGLRYIAEVCDATEAEL